MRVKVISALGMIILLSMFIPAPGYAQKATTYPAESELYTQDDIDEATEVIKKYFKTFKNCRLEEIHYAGDEESQSLPSAHVSADDEVLVLRSTFRTTGNVISLGLDDYKTYPNWNWILKKSETGEWIHVDHGYP